MPKLTLTDVSVRNLKPQSPQVTYWDASLPAFGVRVGQETKTFVVIHGRERKRTTIGRYPSITLAQARQRAKELIAERTLGLAPTKPTLSFEEALTLFLAAYRQKNRAATGDETKRLLRRHFKFKKAVADITTDDVTTVIDGITAPSSATHTFVAARTLFNWLVRRRHISSSPMQGLELPHRAVARDRVLTEEELVAVWNAATSDLGDLVHLLILTGQRVGQFTALRGSWIDREKHLITWPPEAMKSNRPHNIPYADGVKEIIERRYRDGFMFTGQNPEKPFTNFSMAKRRYDLDCQIPAWTLHDLRRTFATHNAVWTPPHVLERILAHSSGQISGVAAIYNRHSYQAEMRSAFQQWEEKLQSLLSR